MSRLYPSLEDMKVDQMQQAQDTAANRMAAAAQAQQIQYPTVTPAPGAPGSAPAYGAVTATQSHSLYPSLDEYMGLDLALIRQSAPQNQVSYKLLVLQFPFKH